MFEDKPREKLMKYGVSVLTNADIIALLLRTGTKNSNVFEMSLELMNRLSSIQHIQNFKIEDFKAIPGISVAKATTLIAAIELGRRVYEHKREEQPFLRESTDIYKLLYLEVSNLDKENLFILCIDIKGRLLKKEHVYIGTSTAIHVSIKDLFKSAILVGAYGIILVHNHPSGDSRPSYSDDTLTEKLKQAGQMLSIEVVDHLIIGKNEFYSYKGGKVYKI